MPDRNIAKYVVILTILFIMAFLTGFLAPISGRMDLFVTLQDAFPDVISLGRCSL